VERRRQPDPVWDVLVHQGRRLGRITGTPTTAGLLAFTLRVKDQTGAT